MWPFPGIAIVIVIVDPWSIVSAGLARCALVGILLLSDSPHSLNVVGSPDKCPSRSGLACYRSQEPAACLSSPGVASSAGPPGRRFRTTPFDDATALYDGAAEVSGVAAT